MDSTELYRQLLGLTQPWTVERVNLNVAKQQVDVYVEHPKGTRFCCPECGAELPVYDHTAERSWRHLDSCQFLTYLHARPPRVKCPDHGVLQARLPWAEPSSRFTAMFEALAIDVLLASNVKRATGILNLTWDEAWYIMERAVRRGRAAKGNAVPEQIGIDEKAISKGHRYMTLVCDLDKATVEYVADERTAESLDGYFGSLPEGGHKNIKAVSLDMWPAFINACRKWIPGADGKMVFDRFHIMKHMLDAVDRVRRREHRALAEEGDHRLARTKYLWLYSVENIPEKRWEQFDELKAMQLKTARAWALKESLRDFWDFPSAELVQEFWKRWYFWATHSRLKPVIDVAKTIRRHIANVLTYFEHRITNAVAEGLNSKIGTVQKRACGLRNRDHFKIAVYFHCGGLNLYPVPSRTHKFV